MKATSACEGYNSNPVVCDPPGKHPFTGFDGLSILLVGGVVIASVGVGLRKLFV